MKTPPAPRVRQPAFQGPLELPLIPSTQQIVKAAMRLGILEDSPTSPLMSYTSPRFWAPHPCPPAASRAVVQVGIPRRGSVAPPRCRRLLSRRPLPFRSRPWPCCALIEVISRSRQPCSGSLTFKSVRRTMNREPKPFVKILMSYWLFQPFLNVFFIFKHVFWMFHCQQCEKQSRYLTGL